MSDDDTKSDDVIIHLEVGCTKRYECFGFISVNRQIREGKLKRLINDIKKNNLLEKYPIKVTPTYGILDGQHRFLAAKTLGLSLYYVIDVTMCEEDIVMANSNQDKWDRKDFFRFYILKEFPEYLKVREFMNRYQFVLDTFITIIGYNGIRENRLFNSGQLTVKNWTYVCMVADCIQDIQKYFKYAASRMFIAALKTILRVPEYDHARLMRQLNKQPGKLTKCGDRIAYVRLLEEIYNHQSQNKIRFF